MNAARRSDITILLATVVEIKMELEGVREAERARYERLPESLQQAPNGVASEEAADALDEAVDALDEAENALQEAGR